VGRRPWHSQGCRGPLQAIGLCSLGLKAWFAAAQSLVSAQLGLRLPLQLGINDSIVSRFVGIQNGEGRGNVSNSNESPRKGRLARILELGPAWITAITGLIVALATAGFFVGRSTTNNPRPAPTVTVTVPAPSHTTAAKSPSPSGSASLNGTLLGSYNINVTVGPGESVPLNATKPTQSQLNTGAGDLGTGTPADVLVFLPINGDKMLSLPGGSTPSYQSCTADTVFEDQASSSPGTAFCLSATGRMIGVTVTSLQSAYAVLRITVWQNIS
jgi:hypothetical protein